MSLVGSLSTVCCFTARCVSNSRCLVGLAHPRPLRALQSPITASFTARSFFSVTARTMENPTVETPSKMVQHKGTEYRAIKEGLAHILNPPSQEAASKGTKKDLKDDDEVQSVFYNPIQQFNRDLSVLAIRAYGEHLADLKRQKAEQRQKTRPAGNQTTGKKRKRSEEEGENQAPKSVTEGENKAGEQPAPAQNEPEAASDSNRSGSFTILDALSATGLRALRYASELPFVTTVVANDLSASAIRSMKTNVEYNGLESRIQPNLGDARAYMYSRNNTNRFDVIDLDPYGTAAPFMDAAVLGVKDGGLLCVTCTDAGVWASTGYSEKAFSLYGGIPLKGSQCHEGGLRLILNGVAMSAAKYGLAIEPLLSLSIDFYARVFVRVYRSPAQVKFLAGNTMIVYNCDAGCGAWSTQSLGATKSKLDRKGNPIYHFGVSQGPVAGPNCEHCGFKTHLGGPMWAGPLHNPHFIQKMLDMLPSADRDLYHTIPRIEGMLTTALEEDLDLSSCSSKPSPEQMSAPSATNAEYPAIIPRMGPAVPEPYPFYFSLSSLSKVLHTSTIPINEFKGALRGLGYRSTRSHAKPNSIRTDAPWDVIWEIMREWARQRSPIKETSLKPGTPGAAIMGKSRDNLRKLHDEDQWLSLLKKDLLSAIEAGKDVKELITHVEATLYRSGSRQVWASAVSKETGPDPKVQPTPETGAPVATRGTKRSHPSELDVVFDEALGREVSERHTKRRLVRYQLNPRENWGPLNRAAVTAKKSE